jgi:hypothetical protein
VLVNLLFSAVVSLWNSRTLRRCVLHSCWLRVSASITEYVPSPCTTNKLPWSLIKSLVLLDIISTELQYWTVAADPSLHVDTPCRVRTSSLNIVLSHKQRYTKRAAAQPSHMPPIVFRYFVLGVVHTMLVTAIQHGLTSKLDSCVPRNRYTLVIYDQTMTF